MAALLEDWQTVLQQDPMRLYRSKRESTREYMRSRYNILGFISSGTYGRVYKASLPSDLQTLFAIKKFKPDKEGDVATYTGISQSAIREIAVRRMQSRMVIHLRMSSSTARLTMTMLRA